MGRLSFVRLLRCFFLAVVFVPIVFVLGKASAEDLLAAVLPNARTVSFGTTATAFATALNISGRPLSDCGPRIPGILPGTFSFRPTNPATNQPSGGEGQRVNIAAGGAATFVFGFAASEAFSSRTFPIVIECSNAVASRTTPGVNTFSLGVSDFGPPDIIAITQTLSGNGIVQLPAGGGTVPFVAAAINIGGQRDIVVRPEISGVALPLALAICESDAQAQCLAPPTSSITVSLAPNSIKTFTIRVTAAAGASVPFDPAVNRIALNFLEEGTLRANSGVAVATVGAAAPIPDPEGEGGISPVILALDNINLNGFSRLNGPMEISVAAGNLDTTSGATKIWINGVSVPISQFAMTASRLTIGNMNSAGFTNGRNQMRIQSRDANGDLVFADFTVWGGSSTVTAVVKNEAGEAVPNARVQFRLNEDSEIFVQVLTDANGVAAVENLPDLPINVYAYSPNLQDSGSSNVQGVAGGVELIVSPVDTPSPIDNNEFQLGTAEGWELSNGGTIISHQPGAGGSTNPSDIDNDLLIATSGEAKQSASRTITVPAGNGPSVTFNLRHRFITSEVPGGYCGTKFNDAFGVEIRVLLANGTTLEPKRIDSSMNALGCAAFDTEGATGWMDATVSAPRGSTVQVVGYVQNVGDSAFDSSLVIHGLGQPTLLIADMQLKDLLNTDLQYFSVATTLTPGVGQLAVKGRLLIRRGVQDSTATVTRIVLRLSQGDRTPVEALLSSAASAALIGVPVPAGTGLEWNSTTDPLFIVPNAELAGWDVSDTAKVSLVADLTPSVGNISTRDNVPQSLGVVTRGEPAIGRYAGRDVNAGGDDWARKSTVDFLEALGGGQADMTFNDASKMHAGLWADHGSGGTKFSNHFNGTAVDMKFPGFPGKDNADDKSGPDADLIIALLSAQGSRIVEIGTTFPTLDGSNKCKANGQLAFDTTSEFYKRLEAAGLANSTNTGKVVCYSEHGHIHVDVAPSGTTSAMTAKRDFLVRARQLGLYSALDRN